MTANMFFRVNFDRFRYDISLERFWETVYNLIDCKKLIIIFRFKVFFLKSIKPYFTNLNGPILMQLTFKALIFL